MLPTIHLTRSSSVYPKVHRLLWRKQTLKQQLRRNLLMQQSIKNGRRWQSKLKWTKRRRRRRATRVNKKLKLTGLLERAWVHGMRCTDGERAHHQGLLGTAPSGCNNADVLVHSLLMMSHIHQQAALNSLFQTIYKDADPATQRVSIKMHTRPPAWQWLLKSARVPGLPALYFIAPEVYIHTHTSG